MKTQFTAETQPEADMLTYALRTRTALDQLDQHLRSIQKHGDPDTVYRASDVRSLIRQGLEDWGVPLEVIYN